MDYQTGSWILAVLIFVVLPIVGIVIHKLPAILEAKSKNKKSFGSVTIEDGQKITEFEIEKEKHDEKVRTSNILALLITAITIAISCVLAYLV